MNITADYVKTKLLQEVKVSYSAAYYAKSYNKQNMSKQKNPNNQFQRKGQPKEPRCFVCNKYGHMSRIAS